MPELPRGTVTFLFTDVEGSTRLLQELGERYGEILGEHRRLLREAFERHGGVEVDTQGDAFFVAFARASDALAAAAEGRHALVEGPIRVRMGLHTGEPLVTEEGYVGIDVHRAARIAAAGHGGQILVSQATRDLVGVEALRDLGEHRLKDLMASERIYQLGDSNFPPLKTLNRTNLPVAATPLIGRGEDLAELVRLVQAKRVVTIVGVGGSGKTRLALQVASELAEEFSGGVHFVPVAGLADPELVLPTMMQHLGIGDAAELRDGKCLVVLDNIEHLVRAAPAIAAFLSEAPLLRLLVTSRAPLRMTGEHEYALDVLTERDAVELFLARARAVRRDVSGSGAVALICRRLDFLPLAIELAAARVRVFDIDALLERLDDRLLLLTGGPRDAPERQRTLRSTIDWSHELLAPAHKAAFARLAVFAGSWSLDAAQTVCDVSLDDLDALVEASLVKTIDQTRFLMLETIRAYAAGRLDEDPEAESIRRRHAYHFIALAETAEDELEARTGKLRWLDRLDPERDNIRAALDFLLEADPRAALRLAAAVWEFWYLRKDLREGLVWLETSIQHAHAEPPGRVLFRALEGVAYFAYLQQEDARAHANASRLLELARACGADEWSAKALHLLAMLAGKAGDDERAAALEQESVALFGDDPYARFGLEHLGSLALLRDDLTQARHYFQRSREISRVVGDPDSMSGTLALLAVCALREHETRTAADFLKENLRLEEELGFTIFFSSHSLYLAATLLARLGDASTAVRLVGAADAAMEERGVKVGRLWEELRGEAMTAADRALGAEAADASRRAAAALEAEEACRAILTAFETHLAGAGT